MSTSTTKNERWMIVAILDHLQNASGRDDLNSDSLQEALFALSNAYTLNIHSPAVKKQFPLDGISLVDIFTAGRAALLDDKPDTSKTNEPRSAPSQSTSQPTAAATATNESSAPVSDKGFDRFVQRLHDTTSFFKGVQKDSAQYEERISQARSKYEARMSSKKQRTEADASTTADRGSAIAGQPSTSTPNAPSITPSTKDAEPTEEAKKKAVEIKNSGNAQLKAKQYEAALESYSECIALDSGNAVYYSNRAAAKILLSRFTEAIDDCLQAIKLDASFVRPRERLASAYRYLGMTSKEVDTLKAVVSLDGTNEGFKAQLTDAQARLDREQGSWSGSMGGPNNSGTSGAGLGNMDAAMLNSVAQNFGMNIPEGMAESLVNSDMMQHITGLVRDNPRMMDQMMRSMQPSNTNAHANGNSNGGNGASG